MRCEKCGEMLQLIRGKRVCIKCDDIPQRRKVSFYVKPKGKKRQKKCFTATR